MNLNEAQVLFDHLMESSNNESERKVFTKFRILMEELQGRTFNANEMKLIHVEMERLNLPEAVDQGKNQLRKTLATFEKFLKDNFSLTPKGYYTSQAVGLGSAFGVVFGLVILYNLERSLGISLGISIGMITGLIFGKAKDAKAKKAGLTLYENLK